MRFSTLHLFRRAPALMLAAGLALTSLGACESTVPIACPDVSVIADAAQFIGFRDGTGRDPVDVAYRAEMTAANLTCAFGPDVIETTVRVALTVKAGPAPSPTTLTLPYFVAVVSADQRSLVSKRQFEIAVPMEGERVVRIVHEIPSDATLVPLPANLSLGRRSIGGGGVGGPNQGPSFNGSGAALYANQRSGGGGSQEAAPRRPGVILPGVQSAVPYQVLIGFQLTPEQLAYNRAHRER